MSILNSHPNAHFLDLTNTEGYKNTFKDAPYYNDTVMYYDENHINQYGIIAYARETEKDFMHKLDSILLIHNKKLVNGELVEIE